MELIKYIFSKCSLNWSHHSYAVLAWGRQRNHLHKLTKKMS